MPLPHQRFSHRGLSALVSFIVFILESYNIGTYIPLYPVTESRRRFSATPCLGGGRGGTYHARPRAQRTTPSGGNTLPSGGGYWVCIAIHRVCSDMHQKQAICRKQSQLLNKILILLVNFGRVKRGRTLKYQRFCGDCILCSIIPPPVVHPDGVIYPFCQAQKPPQMRRKCSR